MMIAPCLRCLAILPELIKDQSFETTEGILEQTGVFELVILSDEMIASNDRENEKEKDDKGFYRLFSHILI